MGVLSLACIIALPVAFAVAGTPVVEPGGVVDAASFTAPVVPGSLVSIFGANLASSTVSASAIPLPVTLGGVSVSFNGIAAPLLFVSPQQINAQLPWEVAATEPVSLVVTNGTAASPPQAVRVAAFSPGLFAIAGYAVAVNQDGSLAAPTGAIPGFASHPATPGDPLVLLGSGFGPVNPPPITGHNSLDAQRNAASPPSVMVAGVSAPVTFAGLSPQFVGVYQINIAIPST